MKKQTSILFLGVLFFSFITITNPTNNYRLTENFSMKIIGSSNVHDWESTIDSISGSASISMDELGNVQITSCQVSIPVNSIKSSKGKRMDKKTMKALNEKEFPTITYELESFIQEEKSDDGFTAKTVGNLSIAGTTKSIEMTITGDKTDNGLLEIFGKKDMKMTDFNIKPPTALLGTMKTRDDITIEFRVTLDQPNN